MVAVAGRDFGEEGAARKHVDKAWQHGRATFEEAITSTAARLRTSTVHVRTSICPVRPERISMPRWPHPRRVMGAASAMVCGFSLHGRAQSCTMSPYLSMAILCRSNRSSKSCSSPCGSYKHRRGKERREGARGCETARENTNCEAQGETARQTPHLGEKTCCMQKTALAPSEWRVV